MLLIAHLRNARDSRNYPMFEKNRIPSEPNSDKIATVEKTTVAPSTVVERLV